MIVIGIIVLLIAFAVPAFNLISGSRSVEGASNQISAALGRARAQAIGLQKIFGVMFYLEPRSKRVHLTIVEDVTESNGPAQSVNVDVWLDIMDLDHDGVADAEALPLPPGVTAQTMCDAALFFNSTQSQRLDDGYLGFNQKCMNNALTTPNNVNTAPTNGVPGADYGGVILFDGSGRLISTRYGFRCWTSTANQMTLMGQLLKPERANEDMVPGAKAGIEMRSQFGFLLFESDPFLTQGFVLTDPKLSSTNPQTAYGSLGSGNNADEAHEEDWIDKNAAPLLINRYNGTLVRGQ